MRFRRTKILLVAVLAPSALNPLFAVAEDVSGTVRISQVHVAFLVSGNVGGGSLQFQGSRYEFKIGGLGYGGIGASKMEAVGEVYGLTRIEDFQGAYAQVRVGAVAGTEQVGKGNLWLSNSKGVQINLRSTREGLALALGGDAVYVQFK